MLSVLMCVVHPVVLSSYLYYLHYFSYFLFC